MLAIENASALDILVSVSYVNSFCTNAQIIATNNSSWSKNIDYQEN